jgi:hypothetical protein
MARRRRQTPAPALASAPSRRPSRRVPLPTAAAAAVITAAAIDIPDTATATEKASFSQIEIDIVNQAELRTNARNILSTIHMARPYNTTKEYKPKQVEFTQFCEHKQYQDRDTVTEDKLLLFLQECVVNRPLRTKSRMADGSIAQGDSRLAWRSVRGYVTAVTDLYRTQKALGMNSYPTPREDNVREFIKSLQRRDIERERL